MPYASKRKANIGKELKQEASKCKKVTEFFTRKDNATTLCDTNVDKSSELNTSMAPVISPVDS